MLPYLLVSSYCNHRVVEYLLNGTYVRSLPSEVAGLRLFVPHSVALRDDVLYVADRENGRIVSYNTTTGTAAVFVDTGAIGDTVYAITFSSHDGRWPMFAVNGSGSSYNGRGFTIDDKGDIIGEWGPAEVGHC